MTVNKERLQKNKLDIVNIFSKMEKLVSQERDAFLADERNAQALKYLLIEAVEAIVDTCQHILAKTKGIPCEGYVDCIVKAGRENIISSTLANRLRRLADLWNSLIHRYWIIDDPKLYEETKESKGDLTKFVQQIESYILSQSAQSGIS